MKKALIFAVLAAALVPCLAVMAAGTIRPVAMTGSVEWPSQTPHGGGQSIVADAWKCTDGLPISVVRWWGTYHSPLEAGKHPDHTPPAFQPTAFILKMYDDAGGVPGAVKHEAEIEAGKCNQAFAGEAAVNGGFYQAVFGYVAALETEWQQEKDKTYWLSVQAKFDREPVIGTDGFVHWGRVSTVPGDTLPHGGQSSVDGTTWNAVEITPGEPVSFAFEIGSPPVSVKANRATFKRSGEISVTADVAKTDAPCWPFVRIRQPNGETLYLDQSRGFVAEVAPYLGIKAGPVALPGIRGYPVLRDAQFRDMPTGTYVLEGGAVDTATKDIDDLKYVGVVSGEALSVEE